MRKNTQLLVPEKFMMLYMSEKIICFYCCFGTN